MPADDGYDLGALPGSDPLPYVNQREQPRSNDFHTFWNNWRQTQAARIERGTK